MDFEFKINNLYEQISSAKIDPVAGIRIAHLAGDELFSLFGAEISPYKKINAHYHNSGIEIYNIVEGEGTMYTGKQGSGRVIGNPPFALMKGDCFSISPGEFHQLYNKSDNRLIVIFGCPKSHLSEDRFVVEGFKE